MITLNCTASLYYSFRKQGVLQLTEEVSVVVFWFDFLTEEVREDLGLLNQTGTLLSRFVHAVTCCKCNQNVVDLSWFSKMTTPMWAISIYIYLSPDVQIAVQIDYHHRHHHHHRRRCRRRRHHYNMTALHCYNHVIQFWTNFAFNTKFERCPVVENDRKQIKTHKRIKMNTF